ncbi:MAG: polyprenyl synthetase family protein [Chloroflexi bacterium]|nr:polyprenyl synthetase family protein [Chloroflexota bacterium]
MWRERQAELLRGELEAVLAPLSVVDGLHALVAQPLSGTGRGLDAGEAQEGLAPLLPLVACQAIAGHFECALPLAACRQFLLAAADVFDDIEDDDSPHSLSARHGRAVAVNVATTLLILAEKALTRLEMRGVPSDTIVRIADTVNSFYTTACGGQHLDLSLASRVSASEDAYFWVSSMKSASQAESACRAGAMLATENQPLIDSLGRFGHNLGMASQVSNDVQGVIEGRDIVKRKNTLPVIYALANADGEVRRRLEDAFFRQSGPAPDPETIREALFCSGAVHYAVVKVELFKQQARDALAEAEKAGASVERLALFLE